MTQLDALCPLPDGPRRTRVMGVVNITPDSFSDGGRYLTPVAALSHALLLIEQGADILDLGGESSRPGAPPVSEQVERERVIPLLRGIRKQSDIAISIDTTKAAIAKEALHEGATIINDISALQSDSSMAAVIADANAWVVLMHMQGTPGTMQQDPHYFDVTNEVAESLQATATQAIAHGIAQNRIILDPGIGFGKTLQHNLDLLASNRIATLGYPVLVGCSRKSMIATLTSQPDPDKRLPGSLAAAAAAVQQGASIVRVHDVRETVDFFTVLDAATATQQEVCGA